MSFLKKNGVNLLLIVIVAFLLGAIFLRSDKKKSRPVNTVNNQQQNSEKIDLKGKYVCKYTASDGDYTAYINNKKIYYEKRNGKNYQYVVLNGDCLYQWTNQSNKGSRGCGLTTYVNLYDSLANLGPGIESYLDTAMKELNIQNTSTEAISALMKSCQKTSTVNERAFDIPKQIIFK